MTSLQASLTPASGGPSIALVAVFAVWRRNHLTRAHLKTLNSEQLADIGLSRAQARLEAKKPFWQSAASLAGRAEGPDDER